MSDADRIVNELRSYSPEKNNKDFEGILRQVSRMAADRDATFGVPPAADCR